MRGGKRESKSEPLVLSLREGVPAAKSLCSKRVGLEKALFQIEQVVKRARGGQKCSTEEEQVLTKLRYLLGEIEASEISPSQASASHTSPGQVSAPSHILPSQPSAAHHRSYGDTEGIAGPTSMSDFIQRTEENLAIDDAENPLQLLARASYIQAPRSSPSPLHSRAGIYGSPRETDESATLETFFTSAQVSLDVGDEIDPISLGLVTEEEAEKLFS